jgi:hypothetical protein
MQLSTLKKTATVIVLSAFVAGLLVVIFISPIAKHLIEKYDEKYTGRQIELDWIYVNPFSGKIYSRNLKIFEQKSDSIFISMKGLSAVFTIRKLFNKTLELTDIAFIQPQIKIIQAKREFNFDDLVTTFSSKTPSDTTKKPFRFYFLNIKIKNGHFFYIDKLTPVNFSIKNVNIESKDGWRWDNDVISAKVSFLSESGTGGMKASYSMNLKSLDYAINVIVNSFDLKVIEQYLKGFINYGTFNANLDADLKTNGSYKDIENINIKGQLAINDFHFGKDPSDDYWSFDKMEINMNDVNPKNHKYFIDSISLINPYFRYEQYDYLDNLQTIFGKQGSNITAAGSDPARFNLIFKIADYVKILTKNFFRSDYKINKLSINNACFKYIDYSLTEKFSIEANHLYVSADSVNKNDERVDVFFKSDVQPYGKISITLSINPKDSTDFDMKYQLQSIPVSMFNPYMITYTSFPFDRGTLELNGQWKVRNGIIKSRNHLLIIDPRVASRIKNEDAKWLPSPLMMYFIRERGNVIDYEIPITGNLKNPKFHLRDAIVDILGNVFVKPPTTPYRTEIRKTEEEIEKALTLKWEMRQSALLPNQEKFIRKMANFLINKPEANIAVYPVLYAEKEKEYILYFEARKKYFLSLNAQKGQKLSEDDSLKVDKMSVKDSLFIHFLNKKVNDTMLFTVQGKCNRLVGSELVNIKFSQLNKSRADAFMLEFKKKGVDKRIKIYPGDNSIPYNGFSFYKIEYNNDYPEDLIKAYQQMEEYNDIPPRKMFEKEREENWKVMKIN